MEKNNKIKEIVALYSRVVGNYYELEEWQRFDVKFLGEDISDENFEYLMSLNDKEIYTILNMPFQCYENYSISLIKWIKENIINEYVINSLSKDIELNNEKEDLIMKCIVKLIDIDPFFIDRSALNGLELDKEKFVCDYDYFIKFLVDMRDSVNNDNELYFLDADIPEDYDSEKWYDEDMEFMQKITKQVLGEDVKYFLNKYYLQGNHKYFSKTIFIIIDVVKLEKYIYDNIMIKEVSNIINEYFH